MPGGGRRRGAGRCGDLCGRPAGGAQAGAEGQQQRKKDYEDVCKCASVEVIPTDMPEPTLADPRDQGSAAAAMIRKVDDLAPLEMAIVAMKALPLDELMEFAKACRRGLWTSP